MRIRRPRPSRERLRRRILCLLREHGPLFLPHLAAAWPWARRRTERAIDELIEEGLVAGAGPGDAIWLVSLTAAGREASDPSA